MDFVSIHASRGGSDLYVVGRKAYGSGFQSTLPVGGATIRLRPGPKGMLVSIHASRGGSDFPRLRNQAAHDMFQSTLPVGGATYHCKDGC